MPTSCCARLKRLPRAPRKLPSPLPPSLPPKSKPVLRLPQHPELSRRVPPLPVRSGTSIAYALNGGMVSVGNSAHLFNCVPQFSNRADVCHGVLDQENRCHQ